MVEGRVSPIETPLVFCIQNNKGFDKMGGVKHVFLAKFKDEIPPQRVDELIARYTELATLKPVKSFHWGKDVSKENLNQGFTHVFEATFESSEGVSEYVSHPAHVEIANLFTPALDKFIVIDFKPIPVKP